MMDSVPAYAFASVIEGMLTMLKMLPNSTAVRNAIRRIFDSKSKRIAISAFVGDGAEAFLTKPRGIRLICWPKAGGTSPDALRKLKKLGVNVQFADKLHMKVYWSPKGAVITSANLSTNALGAGNLKEAGVLLDAEAVDIEKIIQSIHPRPYTSKEIRKLDKLSGRPFQMIQPKSKAMSFIEWYESPDRREWRIGWCGFTGKFCEEAKAVARDECGRREPEAFVGCIPKAYAMDDEVLSFIWNDGKRARLFNWVHVDRIVKIGKTDQEYDKDVPCQAVQFFPPKSYPPPPFELDKTFRAAFEKAVRLVGYKKSKGRTSTRPSKQLIDAIARYYKKST